MQDEECIHLLTTSTCYICSKHQRRDQLAATARRKQFLAMMARGVIKQQPTKKQPTDYTTHRCASRLFEDDYNRYNG